MYIVYTYADFPFLSVYIFINYINCKAHNNRYARVIHFVMLADISMIDYSTYTHYEQVTIH